MGGQSFKIDGTAGPPAAFGKKIWKAHVPEGFKLSSLAKFNGSSDPCEYVVSINMQMVITREPDSLKCKLLSDTFREAALRWYMGLPRASINSYREFVIKLVHQFSARRHLKMSITSLFNIR